MNHGAYAELLYREHFRQLRAIAHRNGAGQEAEDVVHDTLAILLHELPGLTSESHALAWASTRVRWEAWRRRKPRAGRNTDAPIREAQPAELAEFQVPVGHGGLQPDHADAVVGALDFAAAMRRLSPRQRRAVSLRAFGLSEQESAALDRCTIRGHRSRFRKGRDKLIEGVS